LFELRPFLDNLESLLLLSAGVDQFVPFFFEVSGKDESAAPATGSGKE
jgi:hypothetical protein